MQLNRPEKVKNQASYFNDKVGKYGPNNSFRESLLCIIMHTRAEDYFLIGKIVLALGITILNLRLSRQLLHYYFPVD
jgi:hypothetical protein